MATARGDVSVTLHGPAASIDETIKAGEALKDLLKAGGAALGADVDWQTTAVYFQCDGCGLQRPDRPAPDEGWTYRDGDDLCPTCSGA